MAEGTAPSLAALFLVDFDQKVGYSKAWERKAEGVDVAGVEFKSLPSGLHEVKEDLVYFVQGEFAGVSAYEQAEADEGHRNASFVAVGALVPLSYGRLGKAWRHATDLRRLAKQLVKNVEDKRALELYWKQHQWDSLTDTGAASSPQPDRYRQRARSDTSTSAFSQEELSLDHPAMAIADLLDIFGPLIFPLYRTVLLRNRVLLLGTVPVQQTCNFVYLLSIMASIPQGLRDALHLGPDARSQTRTLFNVGIYDISFLSSLDKEIGWFACTTDDVLGQKKELYDLLVEIPNIKRSMQKQIQRPTLRTSGGIQVKATQRDLRRYRFLREEIHRIESLGLPYRDEPEPATGSAHRPTSPLLVRNAEAALVRHVKRTEINDSADVEQLPWSTTVYNSFMWWASAGEMEAWGNEEAATDRALLEDVAELEDVLPVPGTEQSHQTSTRKMQALATLATAYFHRLTAQILQPLASLVEDADDGTEAGIAESTITMSGDDMRAMGLDHWSSMDQDFAKGMTQVYFDRDARVTANGTTICGVKIC